MRNLLTRVPKSSQDMVATLVRSAFMQPDAQAVHDQHRRVVDQLIDTRFADAAKLLEDAATDVLAFTAFPKSRWRQIWSNNPQERLNKEIRRRTDVVGIFPNRPALIRLVGAMLAEQRDGWQVQRCYLSVGELLKSTPPSPKCPRHWQRKQRRRRPSKCSTRHAHLAPRLRCA